nr:2273_t:CDS:2 [Entrophospora candida]
MEINSLSETTQKRNGRSDLSRSANVRGIFIKIIDYFKSLFARSKSSDIGNHKIEDELRLEKFIFIKVSVNLEFIIRKVRVVSKSVVVTDCGFRTPVRT